MSNNNDWTDRKRSLLKTSVMMLPVLFYFNKNRKAILGTVTHFKQSYYNPHDINLNYGTEYHVKELSIRLFFGYFAGCAVSHYFYGAKVVIVDAKTEEILSD